MVNFWPRRSPRRAQHTGLASDGAAGHGLTAGSRVGLHQVGASELFGLGGGAGVRLMAIGLAGLHEGWEKWARESVSAPKVERGRKDFSNF
jgi:hypothetical protein